MLQQSGVPEDFVIATGRQESVRKFIEIAAMEIGWGSIIWEGKGIDEVGKRADTGEVVIRIDACYFRPAEVSTLLGNPTKAREKLGWAPTTSLEQLISEMIAVDVADVKQNTHLNSQGFSWSNPSEFVFMLLCKSF